MEQESSYPTPTSTPSNENDEFAQIGANFLRLRAIGFPEEQAAKLAREVWMRQLGLPIESSTSSSSSQSPSSAFKDFKDEFGYIDLKLNNKLAGESNYAAWRNPGQRQGDDTRIWRYKESKLWECQWNGMKPRTSNTRTAQYFAKISDINIDQYERGQLVNEIDLHGWSLPDPFLAQRFINGLKTYAQSYVQQYLKTLRQGRPKTEVPVINLNELIDDLIRY
ncbi:hypothetical protein PAAG_03515 [Paracoccidioides lutzii Pb01]|uniref:Uncharacterized protein n=1 Tax=Paracoccidioides lutzii (strain ATCC MYA-826 / Pb01) TaxID=502779 RepID=C1GXE1_PARBA|nr:hypothetical protein PAAG_03515 [Paracoccidioides lutzii Pb01]EEH41229.1 hypothetical protein PAAG_03515 [Paracoccidioides lutzii Pb01]